MAELHIIGQITEASGFEDRSLFVKYTLNAGPCWKLLEGFSQSQTHLSTPPSSSSAMNSRETNEETNSIEETIHSFSHPIDVHYLTRALQGWPRLEFQVWGVDWLGKCNISAYGYMSLPSQPGRHELVCHTWRPVGDFGRRFIDYITGYRMHLVDPSEVISNGINRHAIQSQSMGTIKVELAIVLRGFEKYGVDL